MQGLEREDKKLEQSEGTISKVLTDLGAQVSLKVNGTEAPWCPRHF